MEEVFLKVLLLLCITLFIDCYLYAPEEGESTHYMDRPPHVIFVLTLGYSGAVFTLIKWWVE